MVYDEGFEFNLGEKGFGKFSSYFVFLKYSTNIKILPNVKTKYYSHCYQTLIGWFHTENNEWGCFYGHKLVQRFDKPTNGEASDKLIVLENSIKSSAFIQTSEAEDGAQEGNNSNKNNRAEIDTERTKYKKALNSSRFLQTEFNNKLANKSASKSKAKTQMSTKAYLTLTSEFTNHAEIVERINSLNLSWKAGVYDEFKDLSISDLNKVLGRKSKGGYFNTHNNSKYMINNNLNYFSTIRAEAYLRNLSK